MTEYQHPASIYRQNTPRRRTFGGVVCKVGTVAHRLIIKMALMLSAVLAIIPVIGRMGKVRFWIAYVSVIYFLLFWIKQGIVALVS